MASGYAGWASRWRVPMGSALGIVYLIFCRPTPPLMIAGGALAAVGVAIRAYAAGHLIKNQSLAVSGPYRYTRNPLYLGSAVIGFGFALAGGSWILGLTMVIFFAVIYWPVIRREEAFLRKEFGDAYDRYAQEVPLFFPGFRSVAGGQTFQWKQYRKNHEYEALIGYLAAMIFLAFKYWLR